MMYQVIQHGNQTISLVRILERQGKSGAKGPIRDRILLQLAGKKAIVLKGSLMLSGAEIAAELAKVS